MNIRLVYLVLIICISTNCELNTDNNWSPKNEKEISKIWPEKSKEINSFVKSNKITQRRTAVHAQVFDLSHSDTGQRASRRAKPL